MKSYLRFSIICLIVLCLLQGCIRFADAPVTEIISPETNVQAFEGKAKAVLKWMLENKHYLNKQPSMYILVSDTSVFCHLGVVDQPGSWTRGKIQKVKLTVYHNHFVINVEGIGEAGFTFDEDRGLQVYDLSQKDN